MFDVTCPEAVKARDWLAAKDGEMLMGFGIFNGVEGIVDHQLVGIHHVNETVAREQWIYRAIGFLVWGAAMLVVGWLLLRSGKAECPGERTPI